MTDVGPSFILHACSVLKCMYTTKNKMTARNNICFPWDQWIQKIFSRNKMTDRGSKKVVIQKMSAMFSCAHRACMVVYSNAACNTCHPMTSAERMRKPQLQSTDLQPETQVSKRAGTFLEMTDLGPTFPVRGQIVPVDSTPCQGDLAARPPAG